MSAHLGLLHTIDALYADVVTQPERWNEASFTDWAADVSASAVELHGDERRAVRAALRVAVKLRSFWAEAGEPADQDWRSRVDLAMGARAWRPTLDLAMAGLDRAPAPELYEEVQERFRLVHSERWMDGVSYEEWLDARVPK